MHNIIDDTKIQISEAEEARRREVVRQADANNRIEGIFGSTSDPAFGAYIRGEIEVTAIVPRLKLSLGLA